MSENWTRPKVLALDFPITTVKYLAEQLEREIEFYFCSEYDQAINYLQENPDTAAVICGDKVNESSSVEFFNHLKLILPNAARGWITENIQLTDILPLQKSELVNQVMPAQMPLEQLALRVLELVQVGRMKWQLQEIEKIAITDPVTGLPNSRFFQSSHEVLLDKSLPDKKPFSLFIIDIDQFKNFNESFGYGEGDKLLGAIGERIRKLIPDNLSIFRLGSDEFAILKSDISLNDSHEFAERIRQGFEQYPFLGPYRRHAYVTVSVGIAHFPDHGLAYPEIMTAAKAALNQAKRRGRNQTVVSHLC